MKNKLLLLSIMVFSAFLLGGCGGKMQDGFYTAESAEFSHGWKEYVCILVKDGEIVSVEYNAKDPSGFIKAWDNEYMKNMNVVSGTYPNEYTRICSKDLMDKQSADNIDVVTGATHSSVLFPLLAEAAIDHSIRGDDATAVVSE